MYVCLRLSLCMWVLDPKTPETCIYSPTAEVTAGGEQPDGGAGSRTQALWRNSKGSSLLSSFLSPSPGIFYHKLHIAIYAAIIMFSTHVLIFRLYILLFASV